MLVVAGVVAAVAVVVVSVVGQLEVVDKLL